MNESVSDRPKVRLWRLVGLYPYFFPLLSCAALGMAVLWAFLLDTIGATIGALGTGLKPSYEIEDWCTRKALELTLGRPWQALFLGVLMGCLLALNHKRRLKRALANEAYMSRLFEYYVVPLRTCRREASAAWQPFRPSAYMVFGVVVLGLLICWVGGLSIKPFLYGMLAPFFLEYPERRRLYRDQLDRLRSQGRLDREGEATLRRIRFWIGSTSVILSVAIVGLLLYFAWIAAGYFGLAGRIG